MRRRPIASRVSVRRVAFARSKGAGARNPRQLRPWGVHGSCPHRDDHSAQGFLFLIAAPAFARRFEQRRMSIKVEGWSLFW